MFMLKRMELAWQLRGRGKGTRCMCIVSKSAWKEGKMSIFRGNFIPPPPSPDQYHLFVELLVLGFWFTTVPFQVLVNRRNWVTNCSLLPNLCVSANPCQRSKTDPVSATQLEVSCSHTPPGCWLHVAAHAPQLLAQMQRGCRAPGRLTCSWDQAAWVVQYIKHLFTASHCSPRCWCAAGSPQEWAEQRRGRLHPHRQLHSQHRGETNKMWVLGNTCPSSTCWNKHIQLVSARPSSTENLSIESFLWTAEKLWYLCSSFPWAEPSSSPCWRSLHALRAEITLLKKWACLLGIFSSNNPICTKNLSSAS